MRTFHEIIKKFAKTDIMRKQTKILRSNTEFIIGWLTVMGVCGRTET